MKPLYLVLAGIFCFQYAATSQTYYTLTSGNWNNTTNVWSLNGTTPCGCFPGNTLVSDTLYVSHPLNLTAHINASATSKIQVGNVLKKKQLQVLILQKDNHMLMMLYIHFTEGRQMALAEELILKLKMVSKIIKKNLI
jgi:hypothetical protein